MAKQEENTVASSQIKVRTNTQSYTCIFIDTIILTHGKGLFV